MLLADTWSRWQKLKGNNTYLLTGTDEHGLKIQSTAEKLNLQPQDLVDKVSENFKNLAKNLDIRYDRFIRTTDVDHVENVKKFWNLMNERGYIYKGSHSGWYSVSDETFYPESQIEAIEDKKVSIETRNEVVFHEETNYFFKLSKFQHQLVKFLEENPNWIKPKHRYDLILNELRENELQDLSISRPSSRLKWSIEVPNDPSQKIYVWFDALLNYHTASDSGTWPPVHVIGKDIIRFHCIYWPIFLLAAGIEQPTEVIVHSHWLSDGFKMSKSLGNVVDPNEISEFYGLDTFRFFMIENSNINEDCKFSHDLLMNTRNLLLGKYCNLINRIGAPKFDIENSVQLANQYENHELINDLNQLRDIMDVHISNFDYNKAIQAWWAMINKANTLFQISEPWKESNEVLKNQIVYLCAETVRICSILIQPVMPELSTKILDRLNVRNKSFRDAKYKSDLNYGKDANSKSHTKPMEKIKVT